MEILNRIDSPVDVKGLSRADLRKLTLEIRNRIVEVISKNGGHLASSLGVVELTIALHYVFDTPSDKIIWDVGHQAYAHKMLTGRSKQFESIRQVDGISGFTRKRGPIVQALPVEVITQWYDEGMGSKAIATRLRKEYGISTSYRTILRVISGQRVLV